MGREPASVIRFKAATVSSLQEYTPCNDESKCEQCFKCAQYPKIDGGICIPAQGNCSVDGVQGTCGETGMCEVSP